MVFDHVGERPFAHADLGIHRVGVDGQAVRHAQVLGTHLGGTGHVHEDFGFGEDVQDRRLIQPVVAPGGHVTENPALLQAELLHLAFEVPHAGTAAGIQSLLVEIPSPRFVACVLEEPHLMAEVSESEDIGDVVPEQPCNGKLGRVTGHDDLQESSPRSRRRRAATTRASKYSSASARAPRRCRG